MYNFSPFSGEAALMKLGRRPFLQLLHRVNWLITRADPPASLTDRFILWSLSLKILKSAILSARKSPSFFSSVFITPKKITNPWLIAPTTLLSMATRPRVTRCKTAIIQSKRFVSRTAFEGYHKTFYLEPP